MSLVGPRPTVARQVERYTPRQRRRLLARPGVTGLAQVSGRAAIPWSERIELDLRYVEGWSMRRDLAILARTARVVAGATAPTGARRGGSTLPERGAAARPAPASAWTSCGPSRPCWPAVRTGAGCWSATWTPSRRRSSPPTGWSTCPGGRPRLRGRRGRRVPRRGHRRRAAPDRPGPGGPGPRRAAGARGRGRGVPARRGDRPRVPGQVGLPRAARSPTGCPRRPPGSPARPTSAPCPTRCC